MKHLLAPLLALASLSVSLNVNALADKSDWEQAYSQALNSNKERALSLLQDRYNALPPGIEKLYISSKLHGFMLLHGQPYYGNQKVLNSQFADQEKLFVGGLNSEEQLDFISARNAYVSLLKEADRSGSLDGKILFEYHLCRALNRQALYHQADMYCSSLHTHIQDSEASVLPKHQALRVIANNQEFLGYYQKALDTYQELLSIIPSYVDSSGVYNDAGLLLATLGNFEQSKNYLDTALTMRKSANQQLELAQTHHSMGKVNLKEHAYESAISHFMQSKVISEQFNYLYGLTFAQLGLGQAYIGAKDFKLGTDYLLQALDSATKQQNAQIRGEIYLALAKAHLLQDKYIAATNFAEQTLSLATSIRSERLSGQALKLLADISEQKGDYQTALEHYRQYARSELNKRDKENKSAFIALDAARRDYINQIKTENLTKQNQNLKETLQTLEHHKNLFSFVMVALLLLILVQMRHQRKRASSLELDGLCGIYNRSASIRHIKLQPAVKNSDNVNVLALIDLDNFKQINDKFGHSSGDAILTEIVSLMSTHANPGDVFGRFGGEEFIVLLKDVDELDVEDRINQLQQTISDTVYYSQCQQPISLSASIAFLATKKALNDFDELYSILDQALYQAKQNGKNTIIDAYNDPIYLHSSSSAIQL